LLDGWKKLQLERLPKAIAAAIAFRSRTFIGTGRGVLVSKKAELKPGKGFYLVIRARTILFSQKQPFSPR